uniref:A-kinase anchoring protein 6 n=1 Tax=Hippocampus comes TaxID=109280 RepID=A0A3Q2Z8M1_HIPCM
HLFLSVTMSVMALSPLSPEPPSPALTAAAPNLEQGGAPLARPAKRRMTAPAADDIVLLHLPQTEAWLRASGARVTRLTSSVAQDADNRHVDTHLLQLKDICEDISDHVEQIHALLETELSLKLLSYSVNIIVDIRTVQLLWHQLRVSVLVLKERLLRGLQDPNGNFTGRTDILQTRRLDALTEVDDCGRLTIRCSRDYFSLDCGITAYELSDYSPGEEPETGEDQDAPREPRDIPAADSEGNRESQGGRRAVPRPDSGDGPATNRNEAAKRSLSADVHDAAPSLPKRVALISDDEAADNRGVSELQIQARPSHSGPAGLVEPLVEDPLVEDLLMEDPFMEDPLAEGHLTGPPYRSKFWLELDSLCPENTSEDVRDPMVCFRLGRSSDVLATPQRERQARPEAGPDRERWYGSEDFLALPAQLHQSETLDVDDWDLTELNQDNWDSAESGDDDVPIGRDPLGRLSPASSGDTARSSDESIERGRPSESPSEEAAEGLPEPAAPPLDRCGSAALLRQLLEDAGQDKDPDVWSKMEKLVRQLDGFIGWLQGALESTGDWTPPEAHLDALKLYLDTHLVSPHARTHARLRDILRMVSGQWEQLRLQIRRQHAWMLRALRLIRARLLLPAEGGSRSSDLRHLEGLGGRALEWFEFYWADRTFCVSLTCSESPTVAWCSAGLNCGASAVLGVSAPFGFHLQESGHFLPLRYHMYKNSPCRLCAPRSPSLRSQDAAGPPGADVPERLRASVEELKAWLRRTELLIYDSCLRRPHRDARRQLASFKTLCSDVRARRRGVSRLLKLCRRLLRHDQDLQLLSINLERRWEAVLMQTLHWRNRLKRELGEPTVGAPRPGFPPSPLRITLPGRPPAPPCLRALLWSPSCRRAVSCSPPRSTSIAAPRWRAAWPFAGAEGRSARVRATPGSAAGREES